MIQAAMMYYQSQGQNVLDAVAEFKKEYGEGQYDPEMVMQIAATVYNIGLDKIKVAMKRRAQTNIEDQILNINQGNFDQKIQQLSQQGHNSGYLLSNTGDNMFLVASSLEELNDVVGHWVSPNYGGSISPEVYYRSRQEIPDDPDDTWLDELQDDIMNDAQRSSPISFEEVINLSNQPPKFAKKRKADLPSISVNTQQPDAISVGKGDSLLGPDSETHGDIKTPGKPKSQVKPQGTFGDVSTEPDSDNRDPGDYGAGKPKIQHPATDQKGIKLPATELGPDSETQMGVVMKDMDSRSKAAPQSMQSK